MNNTHKSAYMAPLTISIEGNIGSGKTTLVNKIEEIIQNNHFDKKIRVLREPVDIWTNVKNSETGETILQAFYRDSKAFAFPFQTLVFNTRLTEYKRILKENDDCDILFCERSLESDSNIFAKMLYDDNLIDNMSYQIYRHLYETSKGEFPVDKVLFMNVEPNMCQKRIKQRGRVGEEDIPLEYLEKCHKYHLDWLMGEQSNKTTYEIMDSSKINVNIHDETNLKKWLSEL